MRGIPNPYPPLPTPRPTHSEFWIPSAAGAPGASRSPGGAVAERWHAGLDWFAPAGTVVRAPQAGEIIEARSAPTTPGKVYGGTVKVLHGSSGTVWVARHVNPTVRVGQPVRAGNPIATVAAWAGGSSHAHLEVWQTLAGGYDVRNMLDPWTFTYDGRAERDYPPPHGATLRLSIATPAERRAGRARRYAGWDECAGPMAWIAQHGLDAETTAAISWRGNTWRGARDVRGVCRSLIARYL